MYQDLFGFSNSSLINEDEIEILEEIRQELVQEEVEWCLEEYEKSEMDIDWSALEQEDNVICPLCQRTNLTLQNNNLSCLVCNYSINTEKNLIEVKKAIINSLENHCSVCSKEFMFTLMCEFNESHIFLICNSCTELQIVV
ncbi:hypothetical protein evm_005319 [Chilo suppressalis]|nr:hypothetical protein evm_005319 [Chilo suppressalis]